MKKIKKNIKQKKIKKSKATYEIIRINISFVTNQNQLLLMDFILQSVIFFFNDKMLNVTVLECTSSSMWISWDPQSLHYRYGNRMHGLEK